MASDLSSVPLSAPTARPRAATAVQPTTTSPRVISRRPSEANGPPLIALSPTTYAESPPDHGIAGIASGMFLVQDKKSHRFEVAAVLTAY
ncbi:hypothetical protein AWENTII_006625 [Aspergillus wentii]